MPITNRAQGTPNVHVKITGTSIKANGQDNYLVDQHDGKGTKFERQIARAAAYLAKTAPVKSLAPKTSRHY
ncbi:MAG: hypothetical protein ACRD3S_07860, partial [Terracidiphilus sp.]